MSFGFSVSDFIQVGTLLTDLRRDYRTAPREYRALVTHLEILSGLFHQIQLDRSNPSTALGRCTPAQETTLSAILSVIRTVLDELERYRHEFQHVVEGNRVSRVWNRVNFPREDISYLQARLHLNITGLKLFLDTLDRAEAGRMVRVVEQMAREHRLATSSMDALMRRLTEQGISEDDMAPHRPELEELLEAAQEVSETASNLSPDSSLRSSAGTASSSSGTATGTRSAWDAGTILGSTVFGGEEEEDAEQMGEEQHVFVGAPESTRLQSRVCEGARKLLAGIPGSIQQRRNWVLAAFGSTKYELRCRECRFVGFQDEKLDSLSTPHNTPLFFAERQVPLDPTSVEYHLKIHAQNRGAAQEPDGLFYRSVFFWKCHVPCSSPTRHHEGSYECPFCPFEVSAGKFFGRRELLEHILTGHVQVQPSLELRRRYNCWIEDSPAIFDHLHGGLRGRTFDILLPRPYSAREGTMARIARDSHIHPQVE